MNYSISYGFDGAFDKKVKYNKVIPYSIMPNTKYEEGSMYYNDRENLIFKVLSVQYNKGLLNNAYVRSDEGNYSLICTVLDYYTDFLLLKDNNELYKNNIINNNKSYTGAEIFYWFFMNDITSDNVVYKGFWKYIDRYSKYRINDYNKYFLFANVDKYGNYVSCNITKDNSDKIRHRKTISREYKIINDNFMKHQVEKDKKNLRNKTHKV